jgi:hypothetical protein
MPIDITINSITGVSPFNIYVCDPTNTVCVYIDELASIDIPNTFEMPEVLSSLNTFNVKTVDKNGCETNNLLVV